MAQTLTPEQQDRSFFAIVASGNRMANGEAQDPMRTKVRLRDGSFTYVWNLPVIDRENPQPNGDYMLPLVNDHEGEIQSQAGAAWLYVDPADSMLHALIVFSTNEAAKDAQPLAEDGFLQLSTEGFVDEISEDGTYGDYWIHTLSPVTVGNDPTTQVHNGLEEVVENLAAQVAELQESIKEPTAPEAPIEENIPATPVAETEQEMPEVTPAAPVVENAVATVPVVPVANAVPEAPAAILVEPEAPKTIQNYLKSSKSVTDFVNSLKVGKGSGAATQAAWNSTLVKNGFEFDPDETAFLPETILQEIATVITTNGELYNKFDNTGLAYWSGGLVADTDDAKVRARGAKTDKVSPENTPDIRVLQPTAFFKFFSIAYDMVARNGGMNGALVTMVVKDLAMKVVELIERAALLGGVVDDAGNTINPQFVIPIASDTVLDGLYGDVVTQEAGQSLPEAITLAASRILTDGNVTLITTRDNAAKLPYMTVGDGSIPMFLNGQERGTVNIPMVTDVIYPKWLTQARLGAGVYGYLVDLNAYKTVGNTSMETFMDFHLRTNEHDFEAIKMFGGGLTEAKAAIKLMLHA